MPDKFQFPKRRDRPTVMPLPGVEQMLARQPDGNQGVAAALSQLAKVYESSLQMHGKFMQDATISTQARLVRAARHARSQMTPAVEALRTARANASQIKLDLARKIEKLFDHSHSFAAALRAVEIRAHFASLPEDQRVPLMQATLAAKDTVTLKALGDGPGYLCGLPGHYHTLVRDKLIDMDGETAASRDAIKNIDEQEQFAELFESTLVHSTADLIDFPQAAGLESMASEAVH